MWHSQFKADQVTNGRLGVRKDIITTTCLKCSLLAPGIEPQTEQQSNHRGTLHPQTAYFERARNLQKYLSHAKQLIFAWCNSVYPSSFYTWLVVAIYFHINAINLTNSPSPQSNHAQTMSTTGKSECRLSDITTGDHC